MRMFNFALVVRVGIWVEENDGRATCTVTNKIIEKWEIGEEELFDAALTNFQKEEFDIISIDEMLNELQPNVYYPECEDGEVKTYMMTNRQIIKTTNVNRSLFLISFTFRAFLRVSNIKSPQLFCQQLQS